MPHDTQGPDGERRRSLRLRAIFDEMRPTFERLLGEGNGWGGAPLELSALRALHEAHPELTSLEAHQLLAAALRVREESRRSAASLAV